MADGAGVGSVPLTLHRRWPIIVGLAVLLLTARGSAAIAVPYRNLGNRLLLALTTGHTPAGLDAAERHLLRSMTLDPYDRATNRSVGQVRTLQGDLDGAEAAFLASAETSLPADVTTTWLLLAAIQQLQQNNYDAAGRLQALIADLTAARANLALACDSKALDTPVGQAWRWRRAGDKQAAEAAYHLASVSAPGCPAFHYWLGAFFYEERRYAEAVMAYQQGLALDTATQAAGYAGLGRAYLELGRLDDVAEAASLALQNGGWDWPHYLLGRVYQLKGDLASAEEHYRQAIHPPAAPPAKDWSVWFSYFYLGWMAFDNKEYDAAISYLQAASQVMPQTTAEPQAIKYIGDVYYRRGAWPEAIREYQRALALAPEGWQWTAVIYRALGDAYRDSDQAEAAVRAYRAVLDRLPDDAYAGQELMKLERGR